jgi:hypothetical protein
MRYGLAGRLVVSQWVCPQLTLTDDAPVRLIDALYLIFKFAVVWQSSGDDTLGPTKHRAYKKQPMTDHEFVIGHNCTTDVGDPVERGETNIGLERADRPRVGFIAAPMLLMDR